MTTTTKAKMGRPRVISDAMLKEFSELRKTMTAREIAQAHGINSVTMFVALSKVPEPERAKWLKRRGTSGGGRKSVIEDSLLPTLHALIGQGHTKSAIAKRLGLTWNTIYYALKRPVPTNTEQMEIAA